MAKLIRCLCGKVYDSTTLTRCPACGADAPGGEGAAAPAWAPPPVQPAYAPPPQQQYAPPAYSPASPLSPSKQWILTGRSLDGRSLRLEITDLLFSANGGKLILGRTPELCHLVVADSSVSKQHAHISRQGSAFLLVDRNSANGSAVNGQFNHKPFDELPFRTGDTLTLGEVKMDFSEV